MVDAGHNLLLHAVVGSVRRRRLFVSSDSVVPL